MLAERTSETHWFKILFGMSLAVAFVGWGAPQGQMPLNFHDMLWRSIPLAGVWLVMVIISAFRFRKKALWLLVGAPLALYWPVWLLANGIPSCYWHGNCT